MRALLSLMLLSPASLAAQFDLTLRTGISDHGAHAHQPMADDHPAFRPGMARTLGAGVGYTTGGFRLALGLRREAPDLVLRGESAGIVTVGALRSLLVSATIGRRLLGALGAPSLMVDAGIARTRWNFEGFDDPPSSGWAAVAGLEGELPLARRWRGVLRVEGGVGGAMFGEELVEGYQSRTPLRLTLELGLRLVP